MSKIKYILLHRKIKIITSVKKHVLQLKSNNKRKTIKYLWRKSFAISEVVDYKILEKKIL